jgi:nucleoside-diphosphate-sugar epimerase
LGSGDILRHLVLGSKGQVGQYVVQELLDRGHEVHEWDITMGPSYDLRHGSIDLLEAMEEADYVHYLASDVGGSAYLAKYQDSFDFVTNNVQIMETVFGLLRKAGTPFYFSSSQMSNMFHSTYGRLKAVGESYTNALGGIIIHFWNVYGLEHDPEKTHVITDFIRSARDNGQILVRTDGSEARQFIYGQDAARMLVNIAEHHQDFKDTYKDKAVPVTSGVWTRIEDIANYIAEQFEASVYFAQKKDTVQGVVNNLDYDKVRHYYEYITRDKTFPFTIWEGIDDMIKSMGPEIA